MASCLPARDKEALRCELRRLSPEYSQHKMNAHPISLPSLHASCSAIFIKVHELVTIAGLRPTDETASRLTTQLRGLEGAVKQLHQRLGSDSPFQVLVLSNFCADALRAALSACDDVVAGVANAIRPCILDPLRCPWNDMLVQDCARMMATQTRMFAFFFEVLGLNSASDQDARLEVNDSLRLRNQVFQDAQVARERVATKARTQSLPSGPAALYEGLEVVTDTHAASIRTNQTAPPVASHFLGRRESHADSASIKSRRSSTTTQKRNGFSRVLGAVGIRHGANPAGDPKYLVSQLCQACRDGDLDWAKTEVEKGADVNGLDMKCSPPLYYAVLRGELGIAKLLVENGARVGGNDGQSSAMVLYAVWKNDVPMLGYLLEQSAPVAASCFDPRDRNRRVTPLELAVETGNAEAAKLLLDHGADVHGGEIRGKGLNPLCTAVEKRHAKVVNLLLSYQARLNGTESIAGWASGVAPLHVAAYRGHDDILDILLTAGADTSMTCRWGGTTGVTALHLATGNCSEMLIQRDANIRAGDSLNQYPLSGAVQVRDVGSVKTLLRHGAPINAANCHNETALQIACRLFATEAKAGLLEHLGTYRAIVGELLAWKASLGSRSRGQIIIRETCKKMLLAQKPPVDWTRLGLLEFMACIIQIAETQAGIPATPPGMAREILGELVRGSVLAQLVNQPPA